MASLSVRFQLFLSLTGLCMPGAGVFADNLHVAVAANFAAPLKALCADYEAQTQIACVVSSASSGALVAQIRHGAPYDVFLSADRARPQTLVTDQLAEPGSLKTYAIGRLAYLDSRYAQPSLNTLSEDPHSRLALANPRLAPYGVAARQVLDRLWGANEAPGSLVMGQNVLQAYQYYHSGNVPRALVAWSLVRQLEAHVLLIPAQLHGPIIQQLVILADSQQPGRAKDFVDYLLSPKVQQQLPEWGYNSALTTAVTEDEH